MKYNFLPSNFFFLGTILFAMLIYSCRTSGTTEGDESGFVEIFDGKTLNGWKGDSTYWRVEDGNLVGEVTPATLLERNTFIIWKRGQPADFELKAEFKITERGNSGINYRSISLDSIPFALRGYQADIDGRNSYTGQNYEERGRTTLAYRGEKVIIDSPDNPSGSVRDYVRSNAWTERRVLKSLGDSDSLATLINKEDWNRIHIVVQDNRMQHYVNDVLMSDVIDKDSMNRKLSGKLGIQVHVGPPMRVEYRKIRIKEL